MPLTWSESVGPKVRGSFGSTKRLIRPESACPTASYAGRPPYGPSSANPAIEQ